MCNGMEVEREVHLDHSGRFGIIRKPSMSGPQDVVFEEDSGGCRRFCSPGRASISATVHLIHCDRFHLKTVGNQPTAEEAGDPSSNAKLDCLMIVDTFPGGVTP
jgi:hypothetical protein